MTVAVTTRQYDNPRTGCNTAETILTAPAVKAKGIERAFTHVLPGDKRGIEGAPLIAPAVLLEDGRVMDLCIYATMGNVVCAFDAYGPDLIWARQVGTPIVGTTQIDGWLINDNWGYLSTGVLDLAAGVHWGCSWQSSDGTADKAQHWLVGVSLSTGEDVVPPINLEGLVYTPPGGIEQKFVSAMRKQRASLLLLNGVVFIPFGSVSETAHTSRGWIIAFDTATAAQRITAVWCSIASADGFGAGIWHAGGGLAADSSGNFYAMTGNGTFDGARDWSESMLKFAYTPPASPAALGSITVVGNWTCWTDDSREGLDPSGDEYGEPKPTNVRAFDAAGAKGWNDMDYGSGSPTVIDSIDIVIGAGKDGICFSVNTDNPGNTRPSDFDTAAGYEANYAKLFAPPVFSTYYPPDLSPQPVDPATLNELYDNCTHHQHGEMLAWNSPDHGLMAFCWGENENLRAWTIPATKRLTYQAIGAEVASAQCGRPPGGMPGGMISLTANATTLATGIVWAAIPYLDANMVLSPGRLLAYDATQFGTYADGSRSLVVLWDSADWGITFTFNKFNRPVVANGYVYLPTYDGTVEVFCLTGTAPVLQGNSSMAM